jgi:hypothetical protein
MAEPMMTIAEYDSQVLPALVAQWRVRCFCSSSQFCKLISYNFADYGHNTSTLLDAELLIEVFLDKRFKSLGKAVEKQGAFIQERQCPQCLARFRVESEQFNIAMWRTFARRVDRSMPNVVGRYLLGFRGFQGFDPAIVTDFRPSSSLQSYLSAITEIE